jgi:outer membrane murein-binding lipoprotein Lpp
VRNVTLLLAALVLSSSLIAGCGCLAADSYNKSACQKYHTDWPHHYYDED